MIENMFRRYRTAIMVISSIFIVVSVFCVYHISNNVETFPLYPGPGSKIHEDLTERLYRWQNGISRLKSMNISLSKIKEYQKIVQDSGCPSLSEIDLAAHHHHDPEIYMNASQLITSKGYPCEEHYVETEDGYILGLQRIPYGLHQRPGPRPVVFLQHGLGCSSTNWITNLANQSLGFILADAGFDVWLGNMRGNTYSRRHKEFNPNHLRFWKFSFDEMAKYDLPAMIKYTLKKTKQAQLNYVGHSQGTMIGFAQFGQDKELGKLVKTFFALGPVTTVGDITSPIRLVAPITREIKDLTDLIGIGEFLPNSPVAKWLAANICKKRTAFLCENMLFMIAGFDCRQLNTTRLPVYLAHTPAGTSVQNMLHFAQAVLSSQFQMYDYGSKRENQRHYNQTTPPLYDASLMETPVALYWGGHDRLADPTDVKKLIPKLKNVVHNKFIEEYDHMDFIWGLDANMVIYDDILKILKKQ